LRYVDDWNAYRRKIAKFYNNQLADFPEITTPYEAPGTKHVFHLYTIKTPSRPEIQKSLSKAGIASGVYYPQPMHQTRPFSKLDDANKNFQYRNLPAKRLLQYLLVRK